MKRLVLLSALLATAAACSDFDNAAAPGGPALSLAGTNLAPALSTALASALPTDRLVVIVNYDPAQTSSATVASAARGLGAEVMQFKHLSLVAALATPAQILSLSTLHGVQGVYDNGTERVLLRESVASIRADVAVAAGYTGQGIGVAIMDSGINGLNPDVAHPSKTVANVKFLADFADVAEDDGTPRLAGGLYVENLANTDNSSGHGTHVAGIVAGSGASTFGAYRGVAPGAHLVGLSVGEATSIVNLSILQAADWLIENAAKYNVQVLNCSWGSNGAFDPADPVNEAMSAVHEAGITVVFAAGNEGPDANTLNRRSANPDVISVAASCKIGVLDPTNSQSQCADGRSRVLANFSSRGVAGDPMYHPDITAPGVLIVSTRSYTGTLMNALDLPDDAQTCNIGIQNVQNYTCASGTSMASPHVAGVAALMEQASNGRITPDQTLAVMRATARRLSGYGEWEVGAGYVDAYAAALAAVRYRR
ncbi:MAG TPA: S8 family serine peptidase [Longimicrobium sp.]|nr:S8 family serine peptidase [Longimicrobium sp.]